MTPRAKNRLVLVGVLVALAGVLAFAIAQAPPRDDAPALARLLGTLDRDEWPVALDATALRDRWDLPGLMAHTHARRAFVGAFVRVVSSDPAERVEDAEEPTERRRLVVAFERREVPVTLTLVRRGAAWLIQDFELRMPPMAQRAEVEERARRSAQAAAEHLARLQGESLHDMLERRRRLAEPIEALRVRILAEVGELGPTPEFEELAWAWDGRAGTLRLRARGATHERTLSVTVTLAVDEGRWVVTAFSASK